MSTITTRLTVAPDGTISTATPIPVGEHVASIEVHDRPARQLPVLPFDVDALPVMDVGPWPKGISLRREDIYGYEGR